MKKILCCAALLGFINYASAQNTFPATGNVGIGTTTPTGKLQVMMGNGSDLLANINSVDIGVNGTSAGWARAFRVVNTSGSNGLDGGAFGVNGVGSTPNYIYMAIPTTEPLGYVSTKIIALNNLGNVGIGTTTPASTLQVVGDMRFGSNGAYTDLKLSTQTPLSGYNQTNVVTPLTAPGSGVAKAALYLKNAGSVGTTRMDLLVDGNVGIGVVNPQNKVVVAQANSLVPAALIQDSGTGDASLAFNVSGASFTWGIDQSDSKKFKLSNSTTLGVSDFITVTNTTGNVGIGTAAPENLLQVGAKFAANASGVVYWGNNITAASPSNRGLLSWDTGKVMIGTPDASTDIVFVTTGNTERMRINSGGDIGMGITGALPAGYKLAVNGNVIATAVTVKLYANWPDYVFKKGYKLPTLTEVKDYIDKNQRLPDMPSEKEVADNGLNLGEMNKILTKKVEELTLYLIEQNKVLQEQNKRIEKLESVLKSSPAH